ncbi:MAG: sulfide/dihydroorotate dehydrogenase-like FAD/NAD-binding protein [Candidatus Omnitrophota bacterium]|nr:sulfide/dihydroorotate dehydrogenase-like FAD/NAD-binding protein [bacterium]MBU3930484.1 sulfide/dihydroorotate dehydrogenase-like FAD/NAD-binding protein [bacterium]
MNKIIRKERVAADTFLMEIEAPDIVAAAKPGQFVILMTDEKAERVPLTIADTDKERGSLTVIFKIMGRSTGDLSEIEIEDGLYHIAGPMGRPTEFPQGQRAVIAAGGIGIALIYPVIAALKEEGYSVISILGVRDKKFLFWDEKIKAVSDEFYLVSDDGSCGGKGFITGPLEKVIEKGDVSFVYAVGPVVMMRAASALTKKYGVKTIVSLNPIMLDGTGMCGVCRVEVAGKTKFACVDGPEFDAHEVDFDGLMKRQSLYLEQEEQAKEHKCRCGHGKNPAGGGQGC